MSLPKHWYLNYWAVLFGLSGVQLEALTCHSFVHVYHGDTHAAWLRKKKSWDSKETSRCQTQDKKKTSITRSHHNQQVFGALCSLHAQWAFHTSPIQVWSLYSMWPGQLKVRQAFSFLQPRTEGKKIVQPRLPPPNSLGWCRNLSHGAIVFW